MVASTWNLLFLIGRCSRFPCFVKYDLLLHLLRGCCSPVAYVPNLIGKKTSNHSTAEFVCDPYSEMPALTDCLAKPALHSAPSSYMNHPCSIEKIGSVLQFILCEKRCKVRVRVNEGFLILLLPLHTIALVGLAMRESQLAKRSMDKRLLVWRRSCALMLEYIQVRLQL